MSKNIRKAFIKDFVVTLRIKHDETMPNVEHLSESIGNPEKVSFNFEVGYRYKPITSNSSINEVFEYTFICRYVRKLQDKLHTCIVENLLEEITGYILEHDDIMYVKAELFRQQIIPEGYIGVGIEKYKKEYNE